MKKFFLMASLLIVSAAHAQDGTVKSIELPHYQPYLPPGQGREVFATGCLSCHSTRYISMQPQVPAAKWEENVKKMIKTYGAPLAEDQAPALAQYLVAFQQAPQDPLIRSVANPEPKEKLDLPGNAQADKGKVVFAQACASCHGPDGKGDGPAMANLLPIATDLTAGHFAPRAVIRSVTQGVSGTSMPAFPTLSGDEIQDVVAFVLDIGKSDVRTAGRTDEAKVLFAQSCASCHGPDGRGDGFNAPTLPRAPTNFHQRQPSAEQAMRTISDGVAGTSMPAWKAKLPEPQRKLLVDYVRTFYLDSAP